MKQAEKNLDEEISKYFAVLTVHQKEVLLDVAKTFASDLRPEGIYTDEFLSEVSKRTSDLENEIVKGFTWEEVKSEARRALKNEKL